MKEKSRLVVIVEKSVKKAFTLKCIENDATHQEVLKDAVIHYIKEKKTF